MAVLKVWDGASWVPVGAGAPAVASPLTVSAAGVIDIQHIEEVGGAPNVGFVAENGNVNLEAAYWAFLASNLRDDGTNWQRYRTADKGVALAADYAGALHLYDTPAGANPATLTERLRVFATGAAQHASVLFPSDNGEFGSAGVTQLCANCYYDGTNWLRPNTALPAMRLRLSVDQGGLIEMYWSAAGANPIAWGGPYLLANIKDRWPIPYTLLSTFANYAAGWSAYGGGAAPYTANISRDPFGVVKLGGLVAKSSAAVHGETMLTLVANLRPRNNLIFTLSTGGGICEGRVTTGGGVEIYNPFGATNTYVSLDGVPPYYAYS